MVRQYRHLKLMKRAGRGNVPNGVTTTRPGELAMRCLACPIPGLNLPDGWENAPPELRYTSSFIDQTLIFFADGRGCLLVDFSTC